MNEERPSPGTLHFFCGKAGSGKSTLAAAIAQTHGAVLLSEDVMLSRLFGDEMKSFDDYIRFARRLKSVVGPLVTSLLSAGHDVVMDFQANTTRGRKWFLMVCEEVGASHVLHHIDVSDAVCLKRIAVRNELRPEGSHHLSEAEFHQITAYFEAPVEGGLHVEIHR